jgi:hypothetical protein
VFRTQREHVAAELGGGATVVVVRARAAKALSLIPREARVFARAFSSAFRIVTPGRSASQLLRFESAR